VLRLFLVQPCWFGRAILTSYSEDMDHLRVLRDKIGRFREEIADIQELNDQFRFAVRNGAGPKSLTAGGKNVYEQSSTNFYNSQTLAAELFRQNK
jgi:hypothetical protein